MSTPRPRKKLIEVALPLEAINKAASREKSIRHGHPSTLHLWWARRPLAAARAVIFAQMVDDPSEYGDVLLSDPQRKREAERELKKRRPRHQEAEGKKSKTGSRSAGELDEPSEWQALRDMAAQIERERLFSILEDLVRWENTTNKRVLERARTEIWQSWRRSCAAHAGDSRASELFDRHVLPAFHDPFAGGGALPLEAQRLGLKAHASDLNPVAVLINKAMIEIPPKFAGKKPVNPAWQENRALLAPTWSGARALAEDVRHYGRWMRDEAERRIGHLYPSVEISSALVSERPDLKPYDGRKLKVIAWLWARTVKSPNPAFANVDVPLVSTFMLSTKKGKEAYVEPIVEESSYRFSVKVGKPVDMAMAKCGTKLSRGANFRCVMSGSPIASNYIKAESMAGRMSVRLMAIIVEGDRERLYIQSTLRDEETAHQSEAAWKPDQAMNRDTRDLVSGRGYGFFTWADLFTRRQLMALTTFSELVGEAMGRVRRDAAVAGMTDDGKPLRDGGTGAAAYAEAVGVYLAFALSKVANTGSSITSWMSDRGAFRETFARQAIPMVWDFAEANPFSGLGGSIDAAIDKGAMAIDAFPACDLGCSRQHDAAIQTMSRGKLISTDPPYYDNIGYADLSDFFYVWLRRALKPVFPELFSTLAVPKGEELVASPYRHGSKADAETFFLNGMTLAMRQLAKLAHPVFPITIYYAFKQSERKGDRGIAGTGWETFLEAVIRSGFSITGTFPIRTEGSGRIVARETNALASSIVLVCRRRAADAPAGTRRDFLTALRSELPRAVRLLQTGNIAPVDLAQAAIGPGMAIYTRHARVLNAAGEPMSVREALALINQTLDEMLAEQEGDFDRDSRWALAWFEQHGFSEGDYGDAETLSTAKNTSVAGMVEAGILASGRGTVRLLAPSALPSDWNPKEDSRLTVWEAVHHLIRVLEANGEEGAAVLVSDLGGMAETARELCYRLYAVCERRKRSAEALSYNSLVQSWPEIIRLARSSRAGDQAEMFDSAPE